MSGMKSFLSGGRRLRHSHTRAGRVAPSLFGLYGEAEAVFRAPLGGDEHRDFIIDKETMKGNYFHLVNDYRGDTELSDAIGGCGRGYYPCFYAPADMRALLERALKSESLAKDVRSELQNVLDGIGDKDNGYVCMPG